MITVTDDTEIENDPRVGDMVRVNGMTLYTGEIIASKIRALRQIEKQFEGPIEEITGDHWIVGGTFVFVDGATEITGDPAIGRIAQVDAVVQDDGSLLARRIYVEPDEPEEPTPTPTEAPVEPTPEPTLEPTAEPTVEPTATIAATEAMPPATNPLPEITPAETPPSITSTAS